MRYYYSTIETYSKFIKRYNTNRISKFEKLSYHKKLPIANEIFNSEIDHMDFKLSKKDSQHINDDYDYIYYFKSKNNNEYRLDLIKFKEDKVRNKELLNKTFISISYTIVGRTESDYDERTNIHEQYDLLMRVKFLLKDFKNKYLKSDEIFMFGKTEDEKYDMYKYIIKKCFPDCTLIIDYTSLFDEYTGFYILCS